VQNTSPQAALKVLTDDPDAQLVDIRSRAEASADGSPDLKGTRKSIITAPYHPSPAGQQDRTRTVLVGWADRVSRMSKVRGVALVDGAEQCVNTDTYKYGDVHIRPKFRCIHRSAVGSAWVRVSAMNRPFAAPECGPCCHAARQRSSGLAAPAVWHCPTAARQQGSVQGSGSGLSAHAPPGTLLRSGSWMHYRFQGKVYH
jgi:rhodanese-related sulfurtransferase